MKQLSYALLVLLAFGLVQAQSGRDVLLVLPDGSRSEFTLATTSDGSVRVIHWTGRGGPSQGNVVGDDDGTFTTIPVSQLARADLQRPFRQTVWIWQLKDGRSLASPALLDSASLTIIGMDEFGIHQTLESYPRRPDSQPFISIIFDSAERSGADRVTLRNGDILSGEILTTYYEVEASYGLRSMTEEQVSTITLVSTANGTHQVELRDGDRVTGVLLTESIELTLASGATVRLDMADVLRVSFAAE